MEQLPRFEDISDEEDKICCRYCHRELTGLSSYSIKKEIPMCQNCEVKHREFEAVAEIRRRKKDS